MDVLNTLGQTAIALFSSLHYCNSIVMVHLSEDLVDLLEDSVLHLKAS